VTRPAHAGHDLSHLAFLYRDASEYLEHVLAFIREGLARAEPVFAALPGDLGWRLRADLGAAERQLAVADVIELGRNPARITLALGTFADQYAGQHVRIITEPLWPARTDAETAEVMKHEALVQLAAAAVNGQILCAYDASQLSRARVDGACHAHPEILERGRRRPSGGYGAGTGPPREAELPPAPASAEFIAYDSQLRPVRALARSYGERAGCPPTAAPTWSWRSAKSPPTPWPTRTGAARRRSGHPGTRSSARCTTADGSPTRWPGGGGRRRMRPGRGCGW
jgi:MEDS: MEthanogen/methylotroph, DcmR Sensory domain